MNKVLFEQLLLSMKQMQEIIDKERSSETLLLQSVADEKTAA